LGKLDEATLSSALAADDAGLRKNGLRLIAENDSRAVDSNKADVLKALNDSNARVKMNALLALASFPATEDIANAVVAVYPKLDDKYLESAAIGVASKDPIMYLAASFRASDPAMLANFVPHLARLVGNKQDATAAANVVILLSKQPSAIDGLKQMALDSLNATLKPDVIPVWSDELKNAFLTLLKRIIGAWPEAFCRWPRVGIRTRRWRRS